MYNWKKKHDQGKLIYQKIPSYHEKNKIISGCMYNQMQKYIWNFIVKSCIAIIYEHQDLLLLVSINSKSTMIQDQVLNLFTICQRSLDQFDIVRYYITWVSTFGHEVYFIMDPDLYSSVFHLN